jgi:GH24 family phage-related lysozyme (muramidase)
MQLSDKGKALIAFFEGMSHCVYLDQAHLLTVGIGHKVRPEDGPLKYGEKVEVKRLLKFFDDDIAEVQEFLHAYIEKLGKEKDKKFEPTQDQYDVCVSIAYNLGCNGFHKSGVLESLADGNVDEAVEKMLGLIHYHVNNFNDEVAVSAGLTRRRRIEAMYLKGEIDPSLEAYMQASGILA